jgi:hypothetical protein
MDLLPLPLQEQVNLDAITRSELIKRLHEGTRRNIEKKSTQYAKQANKGKKKVLFQPGDLVWLHLRKDHFPQQRKSKLSPRGDGPFKVLAKINGNAYKLELPPEYSNVSESESRMTPSQEWRLMRTSLASTITLLRIRMQLILLVQLHESGLNN